MSRRRKKKKKRRHVVDDDGEESEGDDRTFEDYAWGGIAFSYISGLYIPFGLEMDPTKETKDVGIETLQKMMEKTPDEKTYLNKKRNVILHLREKSSDILKDLALTKRLTDQLYSHNVQHGEVRSRLLPGWTETQYVCLLYAVGVPVVFEDLPSNSAGLVASDFRVRRGTTTGRRKALLVDQANFYPRYPSHTELLEYNYFCSGCCMCRETECCEKCMNECWVFRSEDEGFVKIIEETSGPVAVQQTQQVPKPKRTRRKSPDYEDTQIVCCGFGDRYCSECCSKDVTNSRQHCSNRSCMSKKDLWWICDKCKNVFSYSAVSSNCACEHLNKLFKNTSVRHDLRELPKEQEKVEGVLVNYFCRPCHLGNKLSHCLRCRRQCGLRWTVSQGYQCSGTAAAKGEVDPMLGERMKKASKLRKERKKEFEDYEYPPKREGEYLCRGKVDDVVHGTSKTITCTERECTGFKAICFDWCKGCSKWMSLAHCIRHEERQSVKKRYKCGAKGGCQEEMSTASCPTCKTTSGKPKQCWIWSEEEDEFLSPYKYGKKHGKSRGGKRKRKKGDDDGNGQNKRRKK